MREGEIQVFDQRGQTQLGSNLGLGHWGGVSPNAFHLSFDDD